MKLPPQRVGAFLRDPGACRVVLLYGEDHGMIRDRAAALVRAVAGSLDDPFLVAELGREDIGQLADEAASLALTGGRRVVRLRETTDAAAEQVGAILKGNAPALVVLEAPGLATRSRLRTLVEAAPDGAAIACYPEEGRALADTIRTRAERGRRRHRCRRPGLGIRPIGRGSGLDPGGGGEARPVCRARRRVDLDAAMACVGDLAGLSLDDALFAATEGDVARADRALELALAEGATPVGVLRAGLMHLQRLHRVRLTVDDGHQRGRCGEGAPGRRCSSGGSRAFTRAVGLWSSAALMAAMAGLAEAERACKRTGAPDDVLARNAVLALARRAAAGATRRRAA